MAYNELIKNFEKIRTYMREFYVYGFKSRCEYDAKSARSYDDERRRIESWLGDYMRFTQTGDGKNVFLSIDSRVTCKNPFYKAWKAKSFTDKDITMHFMIFDILYDSAVKKTIAEIIREIDERSDSCITFDESTLRKKLKEYIEEGIIECTKEGRKVLYNRTADTNIDELSDSIDFFSEVAPCGVIGSFLQDKSPQKNNIFSFKHHYITQAIDSEVIAILFEAMRQRRYIIVDNMNRYTRKMKSISLVPLKLYISAQNGRQNLIAFYKQGNFLNSYRVDYLSNIKLGEVCSEFDDLRNALQKAEKYMWGVNCKFNLNKLERVMFEIQVEDDEEFIIQRLEREKRCGRVEQIDTHQYRYIAEVFDTREMVPWIRTFICRITKISCSNRNIEQQFKCDLEAMYRMYGIDGGDNDDIQ